MPECFTPCFMAFIHFMSINVNGTSKLKKGIEDEILFETDKTIRDILIYVCFATRTEKWHSMY